MHCSNAVIQSIGWPPSGQLLLTAGLDKKLRMFQVRKYGSVCNCMYVCMSAHLDFVSFMVMPTYVCCCLEAHVCKSRTSKFTSTHPHMHMHMRMQVDELNKPLIQTVHLHCAPDTVLLKHACRWAG